MSELYEQKPIPERDPFIGPDLGKKPKITRWKRSWYVLFQNKAGNRYFQRAGSYWQAFEMAKEQWKTNYRNC